eukprot:222486_1
MIHANRMFRLRRGIPQCRTVLSQCRLAHKHAPLTDVSRVATRAKSDTPSLKSDSKSISALPNQASFVRNPTEPPIPSPPNGKSDVSKDPQNPCRSEPKTSSGPQHKTSPEPRIPDTRETESEAPKADLSSSKSSPKEPNMGVSGDPKGTKSSQKEQNQGVSEERKGTKSSPKEPNLNISEEPNGSTIDGGGPMDFRDLFTFQNALFMSRVTVLDSNITLPPFLNSAKFVYRAITDLMFREDSAQLEEMVSPELMAKMRQNFHSTSTSETALPPTKSRMEIRNLRSRIKATRIKFPEDISPEDQLDFACGLDAEVDVEFTHDATVTMHDIGGGQPQSESGGQAQSAPQREHHVAVYTFSATVGYIDKSTKKRVEPEWMVSDILNLHRD